MQNGTLLKKADTGLVVESMNNLYADQHVLHKSSAENEKLTDEDKIEIISVHFKKIMQTLGLDLNDESLQCTPERVAKMYVKEIFAGLNPANKPEVTVFENEYHYHKMLVEKNIPLFSTCEHHFVPIIGKAHIAYVPNNKVIGLSKINRIVRYCSQRPQVQERLTMQIASELKNCLRTENVAVMIEAAHMCVAARGIKDVGSSTVTAEYSGIFLEPAKNAEFRSYLQ